MCITYYVANTCSCEETDPTCTFVIINIHALACETKQFVQCACATDEYAQSCMIHVSHMSSPGTEDPEKVHTRGDELN